MRCSLRVVRPPQEEDLAGELLPYLPRQVGGPVPAVEAADVSVCLLEARLLGRGQREVADDVQAVAAANCPPRNDGNHDLGHGANESLHFEDMQPAGSRRVDGVAGLAGCVLIAGATADALIAAGAERPAAVAR